MVTSNTKDCFREFIGMKLKGVIFDNSQKTLVFEDGRGLTISNIGTYWIESEENVNSYTRIKEQELYDKIKELRDILVMVGESPSSTEKIDFPKLNISIDKIVLSNTKGVSINELLTESAAGDGL